MITNLVSCPYRMTFFFFNDTATTEIYTLSLHDALPISWRRGAAVSRSARPVGIARRRATWETRSEEHTSELQSQSNLVCRLLLEKKKKQQQLDPAVQGFQALRHVAPLLTRQPPHDMAPN